MKPSIARATARERGEYMNRNLVIVIVLIVLVGGFILVQNSSKTQAPANTTVETQVPPAETAPSAMEESVTTAPENAMEKVEDTTVTLTSAGFEPKTVTIKVGDKVVWKNAGGVAATVDSAQHPTHLVYPKLNLGRFEDGETLELVFDEAGRYNYHDHLNASRFGTVVVE